MNDVVTLRVIDLTQKRERVTRKVFGVMRSMLGAAAVSESREVYTDLRYGMRTCEAANGFFRNVTSKELLNTSCALVMRNASTIASRDELPRWIFEAGDIWRKGDDIVLLLGEQVRIQDTAAMNRANHRLVRYLAAMLCGDEAMAFANARTRRISLSRAVVNGKIVARMSERGTLMEILRRTSTCGRLTV